MLLTRRTALVFGTIALSIALAACGGGNETDEEQAGAPATTETTAAATGADTGAAVGETTSEESEEISIAVFLGSSANTWYQAYLEGIEEIAGEQGATVTSFDGGFDPEAQFNQIEDAIASGEFNAFIVGSVFGPGLVPVVEEAVNEGIAVAAIATPLGEDFVTAEPQVPGMVGAVLPPAGTDGEYGAELIVEACGSLDPCNVAYISGTLNTGYDLARRDAMVEALADHPNIKIVAQGEGQFLAEPSLTVAQDMLQANPDLDVIATSGDQMTIGAQQAIAAAGREGEVKLTGAGASEMGWEEVKAGNWVGTTVMLPRSGGRIAAEMVINEIQGNPVEQTGVDEKDLSPIGPTLTQNNAEGFTPEWSG